MNSDIEKEISTVMPLERFLRIQTRIAELKKEEEEKLQALGQLQRSYLAANSDQEREIVKLTVGGIRELSKIARTEIRELKEQLVAHMPLQRANELYQKWLEDQSPK